MSFLDSLMATESTFVKHSPLHQVAKEVSNLRVSPDATRALQRQLDSLATFLIARAGDIARADNRGTVMIRDVQKAFDKFITPHEALDAAAEFLIQSAADAKNYYEPLIVDREPVAEADVS